MEKFVAPSSSGHFLMRQILSAHNRQKNLHTERQTTARQRTVLGRGLLRVDCTEPRRTICIVVPINHSPYETADPTRESRLVRPFSILPCAHVSFRCTSPVSFAPLKNSRGASRCGQNRYGTQCFRIFLGALSWRHRFKALRPLTNSSAIESK